MYSNFFEGGPFPQYSLVVAIWTVDLILVVRDERDADQIALATHTCEAFGMVGAIRYSATIYIVQNISTMNYIYCSLVSPDHLSRYLLVAFGAFFALVLVAVLAEGLVLVGVVATGGDLATAAALGGVLLEIKKTVLVPSSTRMRIHNAQ